MRFTLDSNILVYSLDRQAAAKREIAQHILARAIDLDTILAVQAIGEFLNAVRRRNSGEFDMATDQAALWPTIFPTFQTTAAQLIGAASVALRYRLQFWDSVVLEVARTNGATMMLTEDMQDGATIGGVELLNPFAAANREKLDFVLRASTR